jgi:uncharacterized protein YehS (DUF1456 family)
MSNLTKLQTLMDFHSIGQMELADIVGYSYSGVSNWFRKENEASYQKLPNRSLKNIENALYIHFGKKPSE